MLFAAVGLVLLIACANAANLLLMRATVRQKEMAIRAAMGAHRLRLIRQLLTESLLIAALGAAGGLTLAWLGVKALVALGPDNLPRLQEINVDGRVLFFTLALSVLTGLIFGLAPALQASRPDLQQTLKEGGAAATRGRHWLRNLLVVGEVAIAMTLLVGAGLMLNSFVRLQRVNPVVNVDKLLSVEINLPETRYPEAAQATAFFQELIRRVESLPGVESVSLSTVQPLSGVCARRPFLHRGPPARLQQRAGGGLAIGHAELLSHSGHSLSSPGGISPNTTPVMLQARRSSTKRWRAATSPTKTRSANDSRSVCRSRQSLADDCRHRQRHSASRPRIEGRT